MRVPSAILSTLEQYGQQHVVRWWGELSASHREALVRQIESIDFPLLNELMQLRSSSGQAAQAAATARRAARATPPANLVRVSLREERPAEWAAAEGVGHELLRAGKVGAILVAGGQGTRLGFDQPKGLFPIGPLSGKSLFQLYGEQLRARGRRAGRAIPYFVMTSDATHAETVAWFERHGDFGLNRDDVYFFQQGALPAVDDAQPRLLLADKGTISTSPDGHGGLLKALARAGLLQVMRERGIEYVYYHQVDNATAVLCDPVFLGLHVQRGSELSTKVVPKTGPEEKVGVLVSVDGRTEIIEYIDMPQDLSESRDPTGGLRFWAGSTAIHVFSRVFLERIVDEGLKLPYHVAHKAVPWVNDAGEVVRPKDNNAHKFEQFIFDALPLARLGLVVEADRPREYNPVKNASGANSPETTRAALLRNHREWLIAAGAVVPEHVRVEVSPLFALDAEEVRAKVPAGRRFDQDTILEEVEEC